jgi:long-chain acyl-CoA synthetase
VPRGVLHSQRGVIEMVKVAIKTFQISKDDHFLNVLPPYHAFGLAVNLIAPLYLGCKITFVERFSPEKILDSIVTNKCTVFAGVPTMFIALLNATSNMVTIPTNLRIGISGGSSLNQNMKQEFQKRFTCEIFEAYGTTEFFVSHYLPSYADKKNGCIGKVLDDPRFKCVIVNESGIIVENEIGELKLKSPSMMLEYYNDSKATALNNGWFLTGDMGFQDSQGYFYLVGRKNELIKRGGERIAPQEIENVLGSHPKILESVVIGISDPYWGQEVKAFIMMKPGEILTKENVCSYCQKKLASYKCPKIIEFRESLPRNLMGKIDRLQLE